MRKTKRKARKGEYVCTCPAYSFPHRMFGGRCYGQHFVSHYWHAHYGTGDCKDCGLFDRTEYCCEVEDGRENPTECEALQEFIHIHEIKIY